MGEFVIRENIIEKYSYLIGQKINKWTVLEIKNDRTHADAICKCDCGTIKPVNIINLINNRSKDCGCGRKKMLSRTRSKNLVSQRFGKLVVEELLPESNKFNRRIYKCKCDCGSTTIVDTSSLMSGHTLSCGCINSYCNMYIGQLLTKNKIEYIPEYRVCIDNHQYRFDFYLPKYNLFVEYDGSQHYEIPRYFGNNIEKNKENLIQTQERDKIKNKYCEDNNINLLRIPYWEKQNIETIISDCLQRLNVGDSINIA